MSKLARLKSFELVCRGCLTTRGHLRNIFTTRLATMMGSCASINVSHGDELSPYVCVPCYHMIRKFYAFRKKLERSDRMLRNLNKQRESILNRAINEAEISITNKQEVPEVDPLVIKEEVPERPSDSPPPLVPLNKTADSEIKPTEKVPLNPPPLVPFLRPLKQTCTSCKEEFASIESLQDHKLTSCKGGLQCNICHKEFQERKKLIGHLKGHMVVKDHGCKICGKRYPNPSTFRVHMRTHTGERPFKCPLCAKGFVRWAGVVGHMKTHEPQKPFQCDICHKSFKIASNLERHKVLHSESLPHCCNYCGKTFSQSDNLRLHIRTYHTDERPYLCNECGKRFVSSTRLTRHMWVHSGHKPYRCNSCSKAYTNSNDLKRHEMIHGGTGAGLVKRYACMVCEMRFHHPCRLNKHMKTHERPFNCGLCCKTFSSKGLLNRHLASKKGVHFVEVDTHSENEEVRQLFEY